MTMITDFDRLLGTVLEADGPQAVPPGLVDAALDQARAIDQRRPFMRIADQLAWPPLIGPMVHRSLRRVAVLALVALLLVAAIAAAVLTGAPGPIPLLGAGQRAYVWSRDIAYVFTTSSIHDHQVTPGRSINACPTLIAGSDVIARLGYGGWELVDLWTDAPIATVDFDTAGMERWSPDARRLAILDAAGRVGIATFDDLRAPRITWYPAPGIQWLDWSLDSRRLATITQVGTDLAVSVLDVVTGERTEILHREVAATADFGNGMPRYVHWSSLGPTVVVQIVDEVGAQVLLLDTARGETAAVEGMSAEASGIGPFLHGVALTDDGDALALATSSTEILITDARGARLGVVATTGPVAQLAWSPDGQILVVIDGTTLVAFGRNGHELARTPVEARTAFLIDRDRPGVVVASVRGSFVTIERRALDSLALVGEVVMTHRSQGGEPSLTPTPAPDQEAPPVCLQLDVEGPAPPGDP